MMTKKIKLYCQLIRLDKIAGMFPLLWPCLISLNLANHGTFDLRLTLVFIVGSFLMRSAGCVINDLVDQKFDSKVKRTQNRPITSGNISSKQAILFASFLVGLSSLLLFFLNKLAIFICMSSILLVIIYPFCKRFTYWSQLFLGITFNIGALVAWATVKNDINMPAVLLYIGGIFWTLGYDTIYAHQDRLDDLKLGLKSTAIKFGEKTEKYINWFYTITVTMVAFAGGASGMGTTFFLILILPIMILFWQVRTLDIYDQSNCARRFSSNILVGGLIYAATFSYGT
jgi:4-hydroxybenzoate polyprenyltransferase